VRVLEEFLPGLDHKVPLNLTGLRLLKVLRDEVILRLWGLLISTMRSLRDCLGLSDE